MQMKQTMLHFGIFSFMTGIWALNQTDAALLILFPVRVEGVFVSAIALILMVPFFVWFTKGFFDIEDKLGSDIICTLAYLDLAVQLILQLTGICGFRQMYTVTHVLLGIALLYTIVMLISEYRKTKVQHHLRYVVIQGNDHSDMEDLFRQMQQEQDEFNAKNAIPQIQIAHGYAEFDPETDRDIEDTRSRADDKMYQKKREIKEGLKKK